MRLTRQAPTREEFVERFFGAIQGKPYYKSLFKFEPKDVWIGLFWKAQNSEISYAKDFVRSTYRWWVDVYICPIPCCLIRFAVQFGTPKWKRGDMSDFNKGRDETNAILLKQNQMVKS